MDDRDNKDICNEVESKKLRLEYLRLWVDIGKWIIGGVVVVIGFLMIRPHEQERLDKALQLDVYRAYLSSINPDNTIIWQRKLNLMKAFAKNDSNISSYLESDQKLINEINAAANGKAEAQIRASETKRQIQEIEKVQSRLSAESLQKKALEERLAKLEARQKESSKQEKVFTEKLTSYGVTNASVTLTGVGAQGGAGGESQ